MAAVPHSNLRRSGRRTTSAVWPRPAAHGSDAPDCSDRICGGYGLRALQRPIAAPRFADRLLVNYRKVIVDRRAWRLWSVRVFCFAYWLCRLAMGWLDLPSPKNLETRGTVNKWIPIYPHRGRRTV